MRIVLACLATAAFATPAFAQDEPAAEQAAVAEEASARLTVAVGGAWIPDYEGSDDNRWTPIPAANGTVAGMSFTVLGNRASLDVIPEVAGKDWNFQLGPVAVINLNRTNRDAIDDPRVAALGEIDTAVEVGGYIGIAKTGILHDYDTLSASLSYRHDVTKIHKSGIFTPSVNYTTRSAPRRWYRCSPRPKSSRTAMPAPISA